MAKNNYIFLRCNYFFKKSQIRIVAVNISPLKKKKRIISIQQIGIEASPHHPWQEDTQMDPKCTSLTFTFSGVHSQRTAVPVECLMAANTCSVPGIVLSTLQKSIQQQLPTTLCGMYLRDPCFTDEEAEAQRG